ncbi:MULTISPECIES: hypothetical protein [Vibrio]|uniref:Uncharacterized protein n=1 Tax=Vibrio mediterranei TaxID=689 RepID=A0A3G4VFQ9_9VIBR|nr:MULTISPECIES: hypothetical protein [Vibrio]AYV23626.1 hypothetical protein ECB94_20290 [Vibrio mediterranei]EDL55300.1 hypothetical protein VSAK1_20249 [Vibrio mediterranei AK1]MCF4172142.1 hypothetical protein [Vibrio sp. McD22-P3]MCG9789867.1 hypothetical protein [Vibrio mediterranei]MCY9870008.1 hypothetical protein [Vibrio barjaei]
MKSYLIPMTSIALVCSGAVLADEKSEQQIDMSSPTEAYTALGVGYGNEGMNLKAMYMLSDPNADRKSGFILEFNDVFDQEGGAPKFSGTTVMGGMVVPQMNDKTTNRNYRFRYGSVNTTNGLGHMVDAVVKDHPFYGQTAVVQAGAVATLPIGDNAFIWPVLMAGGVIMEDNTSKLASYDPGLVAANNLSSSGIDWASTIYSVKVYGRYKFNDTWWILGAWTYTDAFGGKSWDAPVSEGGLELSPQQIELTLGYQITNRQNLRLNFHSYSESGSSDKFWLEYNYAF